MVCRRLQLTAHLSFTEIYLLTKTFNFNIPHPTMIIHTSTLLYTKYLMKNTWRIVTLIKYSKGAAYRLKNIMLMDERVDQGTEFGGRVTLSIFDFSMYCTSCWQLAGSDTTVACQSHQLDMSVWVTHITRPSFLIHMRFTYRRIWQGCHTTVVCHLSGWHLG